jgi:enediyne biosynthesis protein E4
LRAGESYLSSNDPRLHFGLGSATKADVEVLWPNGARTNHPGLTSNARYNLTETSK